MVARALLLRPKLIVADEPVSMVDASLRATILGSLRKLHEELGISIIYISHFLEEVKEISDVYSVLRDGRSVGSGITAENLGRYAAADAFIIGTSLKCDGDWTQPVDPARARGLVSSRDSLVSRRR